MKKIMMLAAALSALVSCRSAKTAPDGGFPPVRQDGKTAIVAHRGYWNCEEAGFARNSVAALRMAQEAGFWGSEFDVHLAADDVVVVNHDDSRDGILIRDHAYADLAGIRLENGEPVPTLDDYLAQGAKSKTTVLVLELKSHPDAAREDRLVERCFEGLKAHGLFDPSRVIFISFSLHMCEKIAAEAPQFVCQYLNGELSPALLAGKGINGIDYNEGVLARHPEYVAQCDSLGMSSNVWTVNDPDHIDAFIAGGVHAVTTDVPMTARARLGEKEFRKK